MIFEILGLIILGLIFLFIIGAFCFDKFGWFKFIYHDIFAWHKPEKHTEVWFDGLSLHSTCKYCGKEIMEDSQGNWFEV